MWGYGMNKSFEKMFAVLELFSMDRTTLSISEIQKETDFPKSTIFRILNTMEAFNFIEQNQENHRYALGFKFFQLGSIYQGNLDFREAALPIMKKIVENTSETVELNILDNADRICVEKVDSPLDIRNFVRIGDRKSALRGASGKVLVAFLSEEKFEATLESLKSAEDFDEVKFRKEMKRIQKQGYDFTKGERVPGSFAISCPIINQKGEMIASITIAGPIQRLTEERETELVNILVEGSKEICQKLGDSGHPYN